MSSRARWGGVSDREVRQDAPYPDYGLKQTGGSPVVGTVVSRGEGLLGAASVRVGVRVTRRWARPAGGRRRVSEADHLLHGDAVASVVVHQPVERAEGLVPDAVLPAALQHPEVLHPVAVAATPGSESRVVVVCKHCTMKWYRTVLRVATQWCLT